MIRRVLRFGVQSNLVKTNFKGLAKWFVFTRVRLIRSRLYRPPVDHIRVNAAKCYPIMHECCLKDF